MPKKPQLTILFFLITFANVLGLLYTAALPDLTKYFQLTEEQAQQTISLFLLGYALGLLIYGPLSSAIGRKISVYIGCGIAVVGVILCIISIEISSYYLLLLGRLISSIGASSGLALTYIIISDYFSHAEARKKLSYLVGGFSIIPALSITLGGFLTEYLSWKSCFYFMLAYAVLTALLCILLPETLKEKQHHHLKIKTIIKHYLQQANHLLFILCGIVIALAGTLLYAFSAEAPFIAINQLKISPSLFGLYNLIPYFGLLLGGFASARLSHHVSALKSIFLAGIIFFIFSLMMLIFFKMGYVNVMTLFVIPFAIFFTAPTIVSNGIALGLKISENKSYASSLITAIQIFVIFLIVVFLSFFRGVDAIILPLIYAICGFLLIVLSLVMKQLNIPKN